MTQIYYTYISKNTHEQLLQTYLPNFPEQFQQRILKYKRWEDAQLSLLGRLLLRYGLRKIDEKYNAELLEYSAYGKPELKDKKIKFNISHSGNIVICVLTDACEIGIDIEKIHAINIEDFKPQMTVNEWKKIENSTNKTAAFFTYWTQKEAVIKANGKGFSMALNSFEIEKNKVVIHGEHFFLREIKLDEAYKSYIAFKDAVDKDILHPEEIHIPALYL